MQNSNLKDLRAVVAGGSIGGLCAGLALHGSGAAVDVFERNSGPMESRGAGIVVQHELLEILQRYGAPVLPTTSCRGGATSTPTAATGACNQCRSSLPHGSPYILR